MNARGQTNVAAAIIGITIALVVIVFGLYVWSSLNQNVANIWPGMRVNTNQTTVTDNNYTFQDNTTYRPTYWDNVQLGDNASSASINYENVLFGTNKYLETKSGENSYVAWSQQVYVSSIYSGISSATITAKWGFGDNSLLDNVTVQVYLENTSNENILIYMGRAVVSASDNTFPTTTTQPTADNTVWYTVDNNVAAYITAAGMYRLWLVDNTQRLHGGSLVDNYVSVRWDNALLSITPYSQDYSAGENAYYILTSTGYDIWGMAPTIVFVFVMAVIIGTVAMLGSRRQ